MSEKLIFSVVNTLLPLFLFIRSSFMAVIRATIIPQNFNRIPLLIAEVAALECLKNQF